MQYVCSSVYRIQWRPYYYFALYTVHCTCYMPDALFTHTLHLRYLLYIAELLFSLNEERSKQWRNKTKKIWKTGPVRYIRQFGSFHLNWWNLNCEDAKRKNYILYQKIFIRWKCFAGVVVEEEQEKKTKAMKLNTFWWNWWAHDGFDHVEKIQNKLIVNVAWCIYADDMIHGDGRMFKYEIRESEKKKKYKRKMMTKLHLHL